MDCGTTAVGTTDPFSVEELPHSDTKPAHTAAIPLLGTIPQQAFSHLPSSAEPMMSRKISLELGDGIGREWDLTGLVKLRSTYVQDSLRRIVVLNLQPKEFPEAQAGAVE
jgi:hypothetical protein